MYSAYKLNKQGDNIRHPAHKLNKQGDKALTYSFPDLDPVHLPTKVRVVKALVFPVIVCRCERWPLKKAEC